MTFSTLIVFFKIHFAILHNMTWLLKITYWMQKIHYVLMITLWDDHYTMTFVMSLCNEIIQIVIQYYYVSCRLHGDITLQCLFSIHMLKFHNTLWVLKIQHVNKKHHLSDDVRLFKSSCISKTQNDIISFTVIFKHCSTENYTCYSNIVPLQITLVIQKQLHCTDNHTIFKHYSTANPTCYSNKITLVIQILTHYSK